MYIRASDMQSLKFLRCAILLRYGKTGHWKHMTQRITLLLVDIESYHTSRRSPSLKMFMVLTLTFAISVKIYADTFDHTFCAA